MNSNNNVEPKKARKKVGWFRGSSREFSQRKKVNMKALGKLRFYLAQKIYGVAVKRGEKYVENGLPVVPLIKTFIEEYLGHEIKDRQARTYAKKLSEQTSHIEIYKHSGRGEEWRVRLLQTSPKWILKMRNDKIKAQEEAWKEEKRSWKCFSDNAKERAKAEGEEDLWADEEEDRKSKFVMPSKLMLGFLPLIEQKMDELRQSKFVEFYKPDSKESAYVQCVHAMYKCKDGQCRVFAYEVFRDKVLAGKLTDREKEKLWDDAKCLDGVRGAYSYR